MSNKISIINFLAKQDMKKGFINKKLIKSAIEEGIILDYSWAKQYKREENIIKRLLSVMKKGGMLYMESMIKTSNELLDKNQENLKIYSKIFDVRQLYLNIYVHYEEFIKFYYDKFII